MFKSSVASRKTPGRIAAGVWCLLLPLCACGQPHGELIGWNTVRYYASAEAAARERTSPFFWRQPERLGDVPEGFAFDPEWAGGNDRTTITIDVPASASLYGLGRAQGRLLREAGRYGGEQTSPWILGVRDDGSAFGVMLDSTWGFALEIERKAGEQDAPGARIRIETQDPDPTLIVLDLVSPSEMVAAVNGLTGRMEMPPLWALGVQTSAAPEDGPAEVIAWVDAAWLACEFVGEDEAANCFDTPAADALSDAGQKRLASGSIGVPGEVARTVDGAASPPAWVQSASGGAGGALEVRGRRIPDLTDARTRGWWSTQIGRLAARDAGGIVMRRGLLEGVPDDAWFAGDPELGGPGRRAKYEGVFGLLAAQTAWDALEAEVRDRRVMVAVPTGALSAQRWTMHLINAASAEAPTPRQLIAAALNSALTAQPLVGASLPSASGMDGAEWDRWVAAAGMLPLLHVKAIGRKKGEEGEDDLLHALAHQRLRLLPQFYTLAFHNFFQGEMIIRPLFMEDPANPALRGIDTAFMLGSNLLVVPPLGEETFRHKEVFGDSWRRLPLGDDDPRLPALYMRPGSIITLAPPGQHTSDWRLDPLTIVVWPDESGNAHGVLYEDEWENFGLFRGQTRRLTYRVNTEDGTAFVRLGSMDGGWGMPQRKLIVRLLTAEGEIRAEGTERGTIRIPVEEPR